MNGCMVVPVVHVFFISHMVLHNSKPEDGKGGETPLGLASDTAPFQVPYARESQTSHRDSVRRKLRILFAGLPRNSVSDLVYAVRNVIVFFL